MATLFDDEGTLTVGEIGRRVERALRRELPRAVWVRGEIHSLTRATSGHVYFDLVGDGCSLRATLWSSDRPRVNRTLTAAGNAVRMADGTEVRIRCEVGWFARRGEVSLRMLAIDPAFTLGRLAEAREVLLARLRTDGVLRAQAALVLPLVPLRVGLVTSLASAAAADVLQTLQTSRLGWQVVACDARVQGPDAEPTLIAGLGAVAAAGVDVVCLVRGGGARTDLAAFDGEALARAIAALAVPVLTGIGHETDTSVADEVAHRRHVTPTACAEALVAQVRAWCDRRDAAYDRCLRAAGGATGRASTHLDRAGVRIADHARHQLRAHDQRLDHRGERLHRRPSIALDAAASALDHRAARLAVVDPARLLERGWSITRTADGRLVRSTTDAEVGSALLTTVADGTIASRTEALG